MAELSPRMVKGSLLIGIPLVVAAFDFVILLVTYLLLAAIVPDVLGAVADSPARFAAWITLVKLPMMLAHLLAVSWRRWMAMMTGGEIPDPPVRKGWRRALARVGGWGADATGSVLAALIVFDRVADPGEAHVWQLVALTAVGPFLLPKSVSGLVWLVRWRWRRRRTYRPRHAEPDEPLAPHTYSDEASS